MDCVYTVCIFTSNIKTNTMKTKKEINKSVKFYQAKGSGSGYLYTCWINCTGFVTDNDNNVWLFDGWEPSGGSHGAIQPRKIKIIGSAATKGELIALIQKY